MENEKKISGADQLRAFLSEDGREQFFIPTLLRLFGFLSAKNSELFDAKKVLQNYVDDCDFNSIDELQNAAIELRGELESVLPAEYYSFNFKKSLEWFPVEN